MSMPVAPALPQELVSRFENAEGVVPHYPGVIFFRKHELRVSARSVHEIDIKLILIAVENLYVDDISVHPPEAWNVVVVPVLLAGETGNVHPMRSAAVGIDHTHAHFRVRIPSIGILLMINCRMIGNVIGDRIL